MSFAARGPSDPFPAGLTVTPSNSVWNTPVDNLPVSSSNTLWMDISNGHTGHNLHADFGVTFAGEYNGIPYNLVWSTATPRITVPIGALAVESDTPPVGGIPIPADAIAENDPIAGASEDRHLLIVDVSSGMLYELYQSSRTGGGNWSAEQLTIWYSSSNVMRTPDFTSADAAGLQLTQGLVRYDEVKSGVINHAIRFTLSLTHGPHIWPGSHDANSGGTLNPPFGMRVRMKANVDISFASADDQVIFRAMKKYGMILADNGGDWFVCGAPNAGWNTTDLANDFITIGTPNNIFEVVDESAWIVSPTSYQQLPFGYEKFSGGVKLGGGVKGAIAK